MQTVYETTEAIGRDYVFFVFTLLIVTSLIKFFYDNQKQGRGHTIATLSAAVLIVIFWYFGAGFWKLLWSAFATFGLFDFVIRYAEKYLFWTLAKIVIAVQYLYVQLRLAVISLINKIKNR